MSIVHVCRKVFEKHGAHRGGLKRLRLSIGDITSLIESGNVIPLPHTVSTILKREIIIVQFNSLFLTFEKKLSGVELIDLTDVSNEFELYSKMLFRNK